MNYTYQGLFDYIFGPIKSENQVDAELTAGDSAFKLIAFAGLTLVLVVGAWGLVRKYS